MTRDEFVSALISTGYRPELAERMAAIVEKSIDIKYKGEQNVD